MNISIDGISFDYKAEEVLTQSIEYATNASHLEVKLHHISFVLLSSDDTVISLLKDNKIDVDAIKSDLEQYLKEVISVSGNTKDVTTDSEVKSTIQTAVLQAQYDGTKFITTPRLLGAILCQDNSEIQTLFKKHGLTLDVFGQAEIVTVSPNGEIIRDDSANNEENSFLKAFCVNLNEKCKEGKIDILIGRHKELVSMAQTLCRRKKSNPLLVGHAGVGKTAIVEGLAYLIHKGEVPEKLKDKEIFYLNIASVVAGAAVFGERERRLMGIIEELKENPNYILFIDEIHTMMVNQGQIGMADIMKPALQNGELRCIGATTFAEFKTHFESDKAMCRRFKRVKVEEPSRKQAIKIVKKIKHYYEDFHKVSFTNKAVKAAVDLSIRYIGNNKLPDKAIDVIDEAGASNTISKDKKEVISKTEIESIVAKIAEIPTNVVSNKDQVLIKNLESNLLSKVYGQEKAITTLCDSVKIARAGLRDAKKTIGSYLFVGPTGVGKTETCKQLAMSLGVPFVRLDMSEFVEGHTTSALLGSPPGYVGFGQGFTLVDTIEQNPYCVLLLDEIEKAHPVIFNTLLQVMDNGTLTDRTGKSVSFSNVILIMTSNAGAKEQEKRAIGFGREYQEDAQDNAIKKLFTPEFRNRLDLVVNFNKLDKTSTFRVVNKFKDELNKQLKKKKVIVKFSEECISWIVEKGYSDTMGARPISRVIDKYVKKPLSNEVLFGNLTKGGTVVVNVADDNKSLLFTKEEVSVDANG